MLNIQTIKNIKPESKPRRYADEKGMYLEVTPKGGMYWRVKYRFEGKENVYSIGTYPDVTLAQARVKRDEVRALLSIGTNPNQVKKNKRTQLTGENTFKHVAIEWYNKKVETWAESTIIKVKSRLDKDVLPYLGKMNIADIEAPDLLAVIKRIESRSPDTAKRALQECGQIFRYGIALGKNKHDPSQALHGLFLPIKQKHFAAITEPNKVGELLRAIDGFNGSFVVKCALQLAPMFFVRIGKLRTAKWQDIDLDKAEWRYFITKTKQDHIVPLSSQAVTILKELQQLTGYYEHVFTGGRDPKKSMSDAAINAALRRMGYDTKTEITGHGFMAMARTILHEQLGFERDVIEHQLAHAVPDSLGTAYNRTKFLEQRKKMMQQWADYLDGLK